MVSAAPNGGEINESGMGDTRGKRPDSWRERDGLFYYFERRRHLVEEEVEGEKLAGRGKFRDRPTNELDGAGEQSIH